LHLATTISALVESLFFTAATIAFSPLYLIDNDRFNVLKNDALDSAKVAAEASLRFFGFGKNMIEDPTKLQAPPVPQEPPAPTTLKGRAAALLKQIGITALKHPDATFLVAPLAVTATIAAYYFGLFETAAVKPPASNIVCYQVPKLIQNLTGTVCPLERMRTICQRLV
jgi:hypothetical protein